MKKLLWFVWAPLILIAVIAVILLIVFIVGSYSVEYGEDEYKIVSTDCEEAEKFDVTGDYSVLIGDPSLTPIADKFNTYLEKIYGKKFALITQKTDTPVIELKVDEGLNDNYAYSGDNVNITITGDNKDHLLRGAYAFLEKFGGVKCFTSAKIEFTADKISFPVKEGGYTESYNDFFEMRDTDWLSPKDDEYSWFMGFNTDEYRYIVRNQQSDEDEKTAKERIKRENDYYSSLGGRVQYISGFGHTFTSDFLNPSKYYDKGLNLECYALDSKGNRRRDELCLSNPKTAEIITREVFEMLENKRETDYVSGTAYDPDAPLQIISLTQSDDLTGCKCKDCVRCAKEHGGYSAPNLLLVNKVAKAVKDAGYDNVAIDTFAYRYTRKAPKDIKPLDNVIIRLCSIECCNSHYLDDEKCLSNKAFMKDLSDWSKICDRIYIWDYCSDFSYFMTLFPNMNVLAHNIRVFYENNVKGVYEEGNYTFDKEGKDPEFAELRAYLIGRVMQNPYCDYQKVIREFCDAYYGEAGDDMFTFITKADTYAGRNHLNIYKKPTMVLKCSKSEFKELNDLFEHAKSVATGEALENVRNSEICWRYCKMYKKLFEFGKAGDYEALREHLLVDFANANSGRIHEVDSMYKISGVAQTAMIDLRPAFDYIVNKFVYGP